MCRGNEMKRDTSFRMRDRANTQVCKYRRASMHFLGGECVCIFMHFDDIEPSISWRCEFQRPSLLREYYVYTMYFAQNAILDMENNFKKYKRIETN